MHHANGGGDGCLPRTTAVVLLRGAGPACSRQARCWAKRRELRRYLPRVCRRRQPRRLSGACCATLVVLPPESNARRLPLGGAESLHASSLTDGLRQVDRDEVVRGVASSKSNTRLCLLSSTRSCPSCWRLYSTVPFRCRSRRAGSTASNLASPLGVRFALPSRWHLAEVLALLDINTWETRRRLEATLGRNVKLALCPSLQARDERCRGHAQKNSDAEPDAAVLQFAARVRLCNHQL